MSELTDRPRLEPYPHNTGPLSPAWREPARPDDSPWASLDAGVHTPTPVLETLLTQLDRLRAQCTAAVRAREAFPVTPVGRADLDALNRILAGIKILNADLGHTSRSRDVAAWPDPVLPTTVLMGPRDLLRVLAAAVHVVAATLTRRSTWYDNNP